MSSLTPGRLRRRRRRSHCHLSRTVGDPKKLAQRNAEIKLGPGTRRKNWRGLGRAGAASPGTGNEHWGTGRKKTGGVWARQRGRPVFSRVPLAAPGPVFFRVPLAGVPHGPRRPAFDLLLEPNPYKALRKLWGLSKKGPGLELTMSRRSAWKRNRLETGGMSPKEREIKLVGRTKLLQL